MPHTYLRDVRKILIDLSADDELTLEERIILLDIVNDEITELTKKLEDEVAEETDVQSQ